jgi:hypothetical protein
MNDVMLIIIRQIKSMPKYFCAKEELCRNTVMPNDIMLNEVCQMILCVKHSTSIYILEQFLDILDQKAGY